MNTIESPARPIMSVEEFMDSGFGAWLERQTFEGRIRFALGQAGFHACRIEHVESHRLSTVTGRCPSDLDFRPMRRIRADLRRAFLREGLSITPSMVTVYRAGSRMLAHVGVLESEA